MVNKLRLPLIGSKRDFYAETSEPETFPPHVDCWVDSALRSGRGDGVGVEVVVTGEEGMSDNETLDEFLLLHAKLGEIMHFQFGTMKLLMNNVRFSAAKKSSLLFYSGKWKACLSA